MMSMEVRERTSSLAQEVIQISKGQLLVNLRFLDRALFELKLQEDDVFNLATNGRTLLYNARIILPERVKDSYQFKHMIETRQFHLWSPEFQDFVDLDEAKRKEEDA